MPEGTTSARIEYRTTGHGGGNPFRTTRAASAPLKSFASAPTRFHSTVHRFTRSSRGARTARPCARSRRTKSDSIAVAEYCAENPTGLPASVRAPRANWCPGSVTPPFVLESSELAVPGDHELSIALDTLAEGGQWVRVRLCDFAYERLRVRCLRLRLLLSTRENASCAWRSPRRSSKAEWCLRPENGAAGNRPSFPAVIPRRWEPSANRRGGAVRRSRGTIRRRPRHRRGRRGAERKSDLRECSPFASYYFWEGDGELSRSFALGARIETFASSRTAMARRPTAANGCSRTCSHPPIFPRALREDGYETAFSLRAPALALPTSKAARNNGTYFGLGAASSPSRIYHCSVKLESLPEPRSHGIAGYNHAFRRATTPTNPELERERMGSDGETMPSDQLTGRAFIDDEVLLGFSTKLVIHKRVRWSNLFEWHLAWRYRLPSDTEVALATGPAPVEGEAHPENFGVVALFASEIAVAIVTSVRSSSATRISRPSSAPTPNGGAPSTVPTRASR